MGLGGVDEQGADISFFDGGEGAESGKLLDADFAFTRLAETGGVKNLESSVMIANFNAVDVAGSPLAGADEGLLFLA